MSENLANRVIVLRDEVLDIAELGADDPPGAEIFDAIVRAVMAGDATSPGLDLVLHDAVSRRLAWGEPEDAVLSSADMVCRRLLSASQRAFRDPEEEMLVAEVATEVVCAAARIVAQAAVSRAGRERAACLREELAQRRLGDALVRQGEDLAQLQGDET
jgi:hypothetical protein